MFKMEININFVGSTYLPVYGVKFNYEFQF